MYVSYFDPPVFYGKRGIWFSLTTLDSGPSGSGFVALGTMTAIITPKVAKAIDSKMDDGYPTLGTVVASTGWYSSPGGNCAMGGGIAADQNGASYMDTNVPSKDSIYQVAETRKNCNLLFHLSSDW